MIAVRHRSASGDLSAMWEFDPVRRVVDVVVTQGNATVAFTVEVCSKDRPRFGAYPVQRVNGESWHVLPIRWSVHPTEHFAEKKIHPALGLNGLLLTNAPDNVDAELAAL